MNESLVKFSVDGGVANLVLNRPGKRNALTRALIEQLCETIENVKTNDSVRLLVLSADGPAFCAGMDLGEMQQRASQSNAAELWQEDARVYRNLLFSLFTLPIPTLAVVGGPALAGGLGIVLACDMVLAAEEAFFSLPEPKRGITAAVVLPLLIFRIGAGRANSMALSGRNIEAAEALRIGLSHEVVAAGQLEEHRETWCRSILSGAPGALAKTKQHLLDCAALSMKQQLETGNQISAEARSTPEAREGLAAFLEKREPNWV